MTTTSSETSPELHELAGQYVLGTLPAADRRAVEDRLKDDASLRSAVRAWEERLLPLTDLVEPVPPSSRLWQRIERSAKTAIGQRRVELTHSADASSSHALRNWWNSLFVWRGLTATSMAAAVVLAMVLVARMDVTEPAPEFLVVLVAPEDKSPGWVIETGTAQQIRLIPLATAVVPQDKALEFWTKGTDWKAPVSLGLVKPGQPVRISLDRLPPMQPNQLFELTLEPATGSPTGLPTGPIQFIGRAVKVS